VTVLITNSHIADLGVFIARTKDAPKKEFSTLLVEKGTPGFRPSRPAFGAKKRDWRRLSFFAIMIVRDTISGSDF